MQGLLFLEGFDSGPANMARDAELARQAEADGCVRLRFYGWRPTCLSLGKFQMAEEIPAGLRAAWEAGQLDAVWRTTGGGAILHDHDLTYSIAMPDRMAKGQLRELYCAAHCGFRIWLTERGLDVRRWDASDQAGGGMCFERRSEQDLVVGDSKILGSAQRRLGKTVLQHGSLLLERSLHYPQLLGIADHGFGEEQIPRIGTVALQDLAAAVQRELTSVFPITWQMGAPTGG